MIRRLSIRGNILHSLLFYIFSTKGYFKINDINKVVQLKFFINGLHLEGLQYLKPMMVNTSIFPWQQLVAPHLRKNICHPDSSLLSFPPHKKKVMGSVPRDDTKTCFIRFQSFFTKTNWNVKKNFNTGPR